ncbi:hypothetical protein KC360_g4165 [Hortaea werneckii]|nr:hypothetical protein KC361_g4796 [Hortaea werneckii]KAI6884530.1 hypothetical protein KC325_g4240 [Hortaea werneckii]KAI6993971.1 hypothetical protein KC359_g4869 [Hortaea werneckii]KAI7142499.1 hypothetical protein KC344_g7132 [Hortaea werneckii]KAI7174670.1 hypothetical protein KC360_g4165 [Hortaea werneckii]
MSLFGNTTSNSTGGSSLFGNNQQSSNTGGGGSLFGNNNNQQSSNTGGGSLFGQSNTGGSSLFGGGQQQQQPQQQQQNTGGGLFGASTTGGSGSGGGGGLFGGNTQQNQNTGGSSLFGNTQQQQQNTGGSSLFGGNNTTQQSNQNQGGTSLFGNTTNQQQSQQPQQQQSSLFGGFNPLASNSASQFPPGLSLAQQQDLARTRLSQVGLNPTERTGVITQTENLVRKWDPNSQDTLLQTYLYNAVNAAYAPFYHPTQGEKEDDWERALSDAPALSGPENEGTKMVPVLVRGFKALGDRVEYQANFVNHLRARLHEMNNSLTAIIAAHQERISVSLEERRRQHVALRERTLRLAVKVQILRNRGYALDAQEEGLRKQLLALDNSVNDPSFVGREDDIWGRMVALRDRARWLEEETKRIGGGGMQAKDGGGEGGGNAGKVPDYVVEKTQKILRDYDGQLRHLGWELEEVRKEFEEWQGVKQGDGGRR